MRESVFPVEINFFKVNLYEYKTKTSPNDRRRNEEICEEGGVVAVPPVLEPVPVHDHALVVPVQVRDVAIGASGPLT